MERGFNVTEAKGEPQGPLEAEGDQVFHVALDKLLEQIRGEDSPASVAGGAINFRIRNPEEDKEVYHFRLFLQQIDGQEECSFCNGTGIEGS